MSDFYETKDILLVEETTEIKKSPDNSKLLWILLIVLIIVLVIEAIIVNNGLNSSKYQQLNKPSSPITLGGFVILWIIIFAIVLYAWFDSYRKSFTGSERTNLNILFGLNLLLGFIWVYSFFVSFNFKTAMFVLFLLLIETLFLIWYTYKFSKSGALWLILFVLLQLYLLYVNNQYMNLNPQ